MSENEAVTDPAPVEQPVAAGPAAPRRIGLFVVVALLALSLDVVSKVLVVAHLTYGRPVRLLGGAVYLVYARNAGAAFSTGQGATIFLTALAVVIVVVIARTARRLHSIGWAVSLGLILGGAVGNLVDRFLRAPGPGRGHVVDWISLFSDDGHIWPIFNAADSAIVCGGVLAALLAIRGIEFTGTTRSASSA